MSIRIFQNKFQHQIVFLIIFFTTVNQVYSQRKMTRQEYIETFKELAMQEMVEYGIPASITMAQGILESGNGNSSLARKANNHFGIKCHDWKGASVKHDDDEEDECFRKYKSVEESYRDHSEFLKTRGRYSFLFELEPDDYKGWAKGLKKAGYATSSTYSKSLIKLIEDHKLYELDQYVLANKNKNWKKTAVAQTEYAGNRKILYNNRVKYVLAKEGDTFESLADEMDLLDWQLPKYNECSITKELKEGDIVYLQPKRSKASVEHKTHLVEEGETIYDIAQKYAIRSDKLRDRNLLTDNEEPKTGQLLLLRKRMKGSLTKEDLIKEIKGEDEKPASEFEVEISD